MRKELLHGGQSPARRPRIPETSERAGLQRSRSVREIVFGAQDGLLTTLGIVTGVGWCATDDRATILLAGSSLRCFAGALSMGVRRSTLGGKSRARGRRALGRFREARDDRKARRRGRRADRLLPHEGLHGRGGTG